MRKIDLLDKSRSCGPRVSKNNPKAYTKDHLVLLATFLGYSKTAAAKLSKTELRKLLKDEKINLDDYKEKMKKLLEFLKMPQMSPSDKEKLKKLMKDLKTRKSSKKISRKKTSKRVSSKISRKKLTKKVSKGDISKSSKKITRKKTSKSSKKVSKKVSRKKPSKSSKKVSKKVSRKKTSKSSKNVSKGKKEEEKEIPKTYQQTKKFSRREEGEESKEIDPKCVKDSIIPLKEHQKAVVNAIRKNRGLLAVHAVGTGKTLTAVTATQCFLEDNKKGTVIVVTPVSLQKNFKIAMEKYGADSKDKRFKFYTIQGFAKKYPKDEIDCKNVMLVIDEAHNLRTEIKKTKSPKTGELKQAGVIPKQLVSCAKRAKKVLLLTATPVVNSVYDMANLLALMDGQEPLSRRQFLKMIEDDEGLESILGCKVSFYKPDEKEMSKYFPKAITENVYIEMSPKYYKKYLDVEKSADKSFIFELFGESDLKKFYNGVRRASNNLDDVDSPKIKWVIDKIISSEKNEKFVVFSNWLAAGIRLIMQELDRLGIPYAHVDGSMSKTKREETVKAYNDNKIKVLLISKAGGEGLDLQETRYLITLEPAWNDTVMRQVVGRAIRFGSHLKLPKNKQAVNVYHLHLVKPDEYKIRKRLENDLQTEPISDDMLSVDFWMRNFSEKKQNKLNNFLERLEKISIEKLKC